MPAAPHALRRAELQEIAVKSRVNGVEKIDIGHQIRDVQVADDGSVWMVTKHEDGEFLRLSAR